MRQCELERVIRIKGQANLNRTGDKFVAFVEGVTHEMEDSIIEMKKKDGLWIIDKVYDQDIESHQLKRNWKVDGI